MQIKAVPEPQAPPEQASLVVHAFPSLHDAVLFVATHPVAGLHASSVHGLPSLQFGAEPPTHAPPEQASFIVHAFPSLHDAVLAVATHPVAGLHASSVHGLPSLQFGAEPPTHVPPEQASLVVHAFPSLHDAVLLVATHPVAGLHESSVHGLPSLQFSAEPPTQLPPEQASGVVQALPSSHEPE